MTRLAPLFAVWLLAASCGGPSPGVPDDTTSGAPSSPVGSPATTGPVTTSPVTTSPADTAPPTTSPVGDGNGPAIDPGDVAAPGDVATRQGTVVTIFDGDSLQISDDRLLTEVRLVGVNAPEHDECLGDVARETLAAIVESAGGVVEFAEGGEGVDQFGRSLLYLSAEGVDINALLVATGNAMAIQSGHDRQEHYLDLMEQAFTDGVGIWEFGGCGPPEVAEGDVVIADIVFDPPGRDDENLNGEWVVLRNTTTRPVDVSGWVLRDESTANRYVFPDGSTLEARSDVRVRVGCGDDGAAERYWCSEGPVWSNGGDTALLLDVHGNVVDLLIYTD